MIAIDPGPVRSAYVYFLPGVCGPLGPPGVLGLHGISLNEDVLRNVVAPAALALDRRDPAAFPGPLVLEKVESYGRPVGEETFETVFWVGRFWEAWGRPDCERIGRAEVKTRLCGSPSKVNDAVLRQRLIDLWDGRAAAIGTARSPGPLRGVRKDEWQALALAVAWSMGSRG